MGDLLPFRACWLHADAPDFAGRIVAFNGPFLDGLIEQLFRLKTKQLPSLSSSGDFWTNLAEVDRKFLEVP